MQCPKCFTTGLEANSRIAKQYDTERDRLVYATRCPNEDCNCTRVPPSEIRQQLKTGLSRVEIGHLFNDIRLRTVVTVTAFVFLVGAVLLATGGLSVPSSLGTLDAATTSDSPYANLTTADSGPLNVSNELGNWTLYEYDGHYVVSADQNGSVSYLHPNGNVTTTLYVYDTRTDAENAILAWNTKHDQQPSRYPTPHAPAETPLLATSNWTLFEYNGSYVVAGRLDGSLVYLYPNGTYSEHPYVYADLPDATWAIINWETYYDQFPDRFPSVDPVTFEAVQYDLDAWDPNGVKWSPKNPSFSDYDWHWDWGDDTDSTTTRPPPSDSRDVTETNTSESRTAYQVQGSVADSSDEPVEGATVHLHSDPRTATTGPNGSYRFENVTPGDHVIYVEPPTNSSLAATEAVAFTMTDRGGIQVDGDPANAVYFETSDGTVAKNSLQLLTRPRQSIRVHGTGSSMASVVRFDQPSNAKNTTVTLTGIHTATENTTQLTGHETSATVSVDGNTDVQSQRLSLHGAPTSKTVQTSGTYRGTNPEVPITGNLRPRNVQITLSANRSENRVTDSGELTLDTAPTKIALRESAKASGWTSSERTTNAVGRSGTYEIQADWRMSNSYYDHEMDGEIRLQICSDGDCETIKTVEKDDLGGYQNHWSRSASGTITASLTLESGDTIRVLTDCSCGSNSDVTVGQQIIATYQDENSGTTTVAVDGNLPPKAASLTLTGTESVETSYETPRLRVDGDVWSGDTITDESVLFYAPEEGHYDVVIPWRVNAYTMGTWGDDIGGFAELTLVVDGQEVLSKDAYTMAGEQEEYLGTYNTTVHLEKGDRIKAVVKARDAGIATVSKQDDGVVTRSNTGRVTVSVNNESKRTTTLAAGESQTLSIPLDLGENRVTLTTSGGNTVKYAFEYVERNGTASPLVSVANRTVCSFSGVFAGQKTCDVPRSQLDAGAPETFNITTASGPVNYTIDYQARATPEQATVTIDGTTYEYPDDFTGSGPLATEFAHAVSQTISALSLGENDVQVSVDSVDDLDPSLVATLQYTGEQRQTQRPVVVVESADGTPRTKSVPDSALASNGTLTGNYTMTLPADWFGPGDNVVRVRTADSSQVRAVVESSGLRYQNRTFNETAATS